MTGLYLKLFIFMLLVAFPVASFGAPAASNKPRAHTAKELQKLSDQVYSDLNKNNDPGFEDAKLIRSQSDGDSKKNPLQRVQDAMSQSDDNVQQIYRSAVSASVAAPEVVSRPDLPRPAVRPEVSAPIAPARSRQFDSWVQRSSNTGGSAEASPSARGSQDNTSLEDALSFAPSAPSTRPSSKPSHPAPANSGVDIFKQINKAASQDGSMPPFPPVSQ